MPWKLLQYVSNDQHSVRIEVLEFSQPLAECDFRRISFFLCLCFGICVLHQNSGVHLAKPIAVSAHPLQHRIDHLHPPILLLLLQHLGLVLAVDFAQQYVCAAKHEQKARAQCEQSEADAQEWVHASARSGFCRKKAIKIVNIASEYQNIH